jgi:hypothetical protein
MSTLTIGTTIGNGRLLDAIGRRAHESEALRKHAAQDRGTTLASGRGEPWVGADWGDGGGRKEKCLRNGLERRQFWAFGPAPRDRGRRKDFGLETRLERCLPRRLGIHYRLAVELIRKLHMKPETTEHLKKVEAAIQATKALLARHKYPDDLRTVVVAGFIDQMIEHHGALLLLIRSGKVGSAFALVRSVFESMYRGLWINFCATDAEIQKFEKDDNITPTLADMAKAIDDKYRANGFFADLKKRGWYALNSYTHTGMLQLGRRFTGHNLEPAYSEVEIFEVTTTATTCVLILVSRFFAVQNHADECKETERRVESYGPALARTQANNQQ